MPTGKNQPGILSNIAYRSGYGDRFRPIDPTVSFVDSLGASKSNQPLQQLPLQDDSIEPILGFSDIIPDAVKQLTGSDLLAFASGFLSPQSMIKKAGTRRDIFVGPKSKTWDAISAQKAKKMADAGVDARTIWRETGNWKGPDGKWRQEIDDSGARVREGLMRSGGEYTLGQGLKHDPFAAAYPSMRGIKYAFSPIEGEGVSVPGRIDISEATKDPRSVTLHEIQHPTQEIEGFASGGAPWTVDYNAQYQQIGILSDRKRKVAEELEDAIDLGYTKERINKLQDELSSIDSGIKDAETELEILKKHKDPMEAYRHLAGEAEARAVQRRMDLTPEQRLATFPEESYDVPLEDLIFKYGN